MLTAYSYLPPIVRYFKVIFEKNENRIKPRIPKNARREDISGWESPMLPKRRAERNPHSVAAKEDADYGLAVLPCRTWERQVEWGGMCRAENWAYYKDWILKFPPSSPSKKLLFLEASNREVWNLKDINILGKKAKNWVLRKEDLKNLLKQ